MPYLTLLSMRSSARIYLHPYTTLLPPCGANQTRALDNLAWQHGIGLLLGVWDQSKEDGWLVGWFVSGRGASYLYILLAVTSTNNELIWELGWNVTALYWHVKSQANLRCMLLQNLQSFGPDLSVCSSSCGGGWGGILSLIQGVLIEVTFSTVQSITSEPCSALLNSLSLNWTGYKWRPGQPLLRRVVYG